MGLLAAAVTVLAAVAGWDYVAETCSEGSKGPKRGPAGLVISLCRRYALDFGMTLSLLGCYISFVVWFPVPCVVACFGFVQFACHGFILHCMTVASIVAFPSPATLLVARLAP